MGGEFILPLAAPGMETHDLVVSRTQVSRALLNPLTLFVNPPTELAVLPSFR